MCMDEWIPWIQQLGTIQSHNLHKGEHIWGVLYPTENTLTFHLPPHFDLPVVSGIMSSYSTAAVTGTGHKLGFNWSTPWTKWPPFRRRYFQMHFHEWKLLYFYQNFAEVCSNWQYPSSGSGNGLTPNRRQAIIWTNADPIHICVTRVSWVNSCCCCNNWNKTALRLYFHFALFWNIPNTSIDVF